LSLDEGIVLVLGSTTVVDDDAARAASEWPLLWAKSHVRLIEKRSVPLRGDVKAAAAWKGVAARVTNCARLHNTREIGRCILFWLSPLSR
jgi:hypothetical protein